MVVMQVSFYHVSQLQQHKTKLANVKVHQLTFVFQLFLLLLGLALELLLSQAGPFPSLHHASGALGGLKRLTWNVIHCEKDTFRARKKSICCSLSRAMQERRKRCIL